MAHNGKTARIHFVQRIFGRMPIGRHDVEIDDVAPGHAPANEREMIVSTDGLGSFVNEDTFITQSRSGRPD